MSKYVPDISTRRWVLIASGRSKRPEHIHDHTCDFCVGQENKTDAELFRIPPGNINGPGWQVRVIKNKFPITDLHEVIILTPHHDRDFEQLATKEIEMIFTAFRHRYNEHRKQGQVLIFGNHKKLAGASIDHPHAQLVVIPNQINLDALTKQPVMNIISEGKNFIAYCPEFSQWPYEIWIVPKKEQTYFGDIDDIQLNELAFCMQHSTKKLEHVFKHSQITKVFKEDKDLFAYNYYIYPKQDWYLRIIPRFVSRAGFELGTGLSVNIVDPVDAAQELVAAPPHEHGK